MAVKVLFVAEGFVAAEAQGKAGLAVTVNENGERINQLIHADSMEQLTRLGTGALYGVASKMIHDGVPIRTAVKVLDEMTDMVINEVIDQRAQQAGTQTIFSNTLNL